VVRKQFMLEKQKAEEQAVELANRVTELTTQNRILTRRVKSMFVSFLPVAELEQGRAEYRPRSLKSRCNRTQTTALRK